MWWVADMTDENPTSSGRDAEADGKSVELPRPNAWPMVLSLGLDLDAAGVVNGSAFFRVGVVVFAVGLAGWFGELLPGVGHVHEPLAEPALRPRPVTGAAGTVEQLRPGQPGYRLRLPEQVHPISAGVKGSIVGGVAMGRPAPP